MTCRQCKYITVCMAQADGLGQLFDPNYDGEHGCTDFVPFTNADRIRAMNDNELATLINRIVVCNHLKIVINERNCEKCPIHPAKPCDTDGIADWLKQPIKEE